MGKNNSVKNIEGDVKSEENQKKEGGKNECSNLTVVLKVDFHCEGCVLKIIKAVRSFEGVEKVTCDNDANKLTVIGKVDPLKLKEKMERKLKKSVQLISPLPKDGKKEKKHNENDSKGKGDDKKAKEKELPVTTAVLKMHLHCEGCIEKMHKIITKNKGYKEMKMDREKDLVTVTGSIDMKELVETLKKQLKKDIEIVPPKREGGEKKDGGDGKGKGKGKDGQGGGDGGGDNKGVDKGTHNQLEQFGYPYMDQIFSDEYPNACSIM